MKELMIDLGIMLACAASVVLLAIVFGHFLRWRRIRRDLDALTRQTGPRQIAGYVAAREDATTPSPGHCGDGPDCGGAPQPRPTLPITIVLNGRNMQCPYVAVCYEDVLEFAGKADREIGAPTITYAVPRTIIGGTLLPGEVVDVHPGMVFNVYHTRQA